MIAVSEVERLSKNADRDPALMTARKELQADALDFLDDMALITSAILAFGEEWGDFDTVVKHYNHPKSRRPSADRFGINLRKVFSSSQFSGQKIFVTNLILDFKRRRPTDKKNPMSVDLGAHVFLDYAREFGLSRIKLHNPKVVIAMGVDVTNALLKADGQRGVQGSFNSFVDHVAERGPPRLTNGSHLVPVFHPGHFGWAVNRKRAKRTSDEQNIADWSVALRYV
jgi:uracil-DNA glycosylase